MAKVVMTIAPEDGMCFDDILSFKTYNYVGFWSYEKDCFMLMRQSGTEFCFDYLPVCKELRELDEAVYDKCDEHILEVFDVIDYEIELC